MESHVIYFETGFFHFVLYIWFIHTRIYNILLYKHICAVPCLVTQLCPTLCDPTDCSPPGSSVHGVLQARILSGLPFPSPGRSSRLRNQTQVSCIAGRLFTDWAMREAHDQPRQQIKKQRHFFAKKGLVIAMVFPVVMCGCESWTIKKAECWRTDTFEL